MKTELEKPEESECCGSGCNPCILDVYEKKLQQLKVQQKMGLKKCTILDPGKHLPFSITSIHSSTSESTTFVFQAISLKNYNKNSVVLKSLEPEIDYEMLLEPLCLRMGDYLILKGEHEEDISTNKVSRAYTPVSNTEDFDRGTFRVIIRLYPSGKMSQFLTRLKVNDVVFWRGPYNEFSYKRNAFQNVLLLGGGTGVVPLYNIAKEIVEDDTEDTRVELVASFRTVDKIVLRTELNKLKEYWNFQMRVYVTNQEDGSYSLGYGESIIQKRIHEGELTEILKEYDCNRVFAAICGSKEFNTAMSDIVLSCNVTKDNIFVFWYPLLFFFLTFLIFLNNLSYFFRHN